MYIKMNWALRDHFIESIYCFKTTPPYDGTGCGLCGIESLEQFQLDELQRMHQSYGLSKFRVLFESPARNYRFNWWGTCRRFDGQIVALFEDVGRHNALELVI